MWSIHEGPRRKPFLSTKGHEGPLRKPLQGHDLGCPQRAAEKTFFDPRRATKDHEENLCKIIIWAVHKGPRRKPFLSTKGHEGPRRKPLQGHNLGCPRRAAEKTFFDPRRATKDHEENLCKIIIWAVHTGPRRKPFVVDSDDGRRTGESGEKRSDSARRLPVFVTL